MHEKLLALAILSELELIPTSDYLDELDTQFSNSPNDELLLRPEFLFDNTDDVIYSLYIHAQELNYELFGKHLFSNLEKIYLANKFSIKTFGEKMYLIWNLYIPNPISTKEPFWTLSYADDCLSYGDEKQTRALYEKAFRHY